MKCFMFFLIHPTYFISCRWEHCFFNGFLGSLEWPDLERRSPGKPSWCRTRWRSLTLKRSPPSPCWPMSLTWTMTLSPAPTSTLTTTPIVRIMSIMWATQRKMEDSSGEKIWQVLPAILWDPQRLITEDILS